MARWHLSSREMSRWTDSTCPVGMEHVSHKHQRNAEPQAGNNVQREAIRSCFSLSLPTKEVVVLTALERIRLKKEDMLADGSCSSGLE